MPILEHVLEKDDAEVEPVELRAEPRLRPGKSGFPAAAVSEGVDLAQTILRDREA